MNDNSKPHRNGPCPCGSGKKYKKCCMDVNPAPLPDPVTRPIRPELKNSFRKEVVSDIEQMRRDRVVLLKHHEMRAFEYDSDADYIRAKTERIKAHVEDLELLPQSSFRDEIIDDTSKQIAITKQAIERAAPARVDQVLLELLRLVNGNGYYEPEEPEETVPGILGLGKTAECVGDVNSVAVHGAEYMGARPASTIQRPGPFGPKLGPVKTDEDDINDDDED